MKARELMFGDLVRTSTTTTELRVCRAAHIDGDMDSVVLYDIEDEDEYRIGRYAKHIKPIPLTEEMLKANGWKTYCEFGANFLATRLDWNLTIVSKKIGNTYLRIAGNWICDVNYVHELQRILRGCGLMDLANNFKLE